MQTPLYGQGMRVRIRRGFFPLDDSMIGQTGLIVALHDVSPPRYGVTLDGETGVREFAEDEILALSEEALERNARGATGPTVGPSPSGGSGGQH